MRLERQAESAAQRFARIHARDVQALVGCIGMTTNSGVPDRVRLQFESPELAAVADVLLRDEVTGARLVLVDPAGVPVTGSAVPAWADRAANLARLVAAMPGVVSVREYRGRAFGFTVDSQDTSTRLGELVEPTFGGRATSFFATGPV